MGAQEGNHDFSTRLAGWVSQDIQRLLMMHGKLIVEKE
jgi:hypothetical protein